MSKAYNKKVKEELYLNCGKICMYSMHKFSKKKLTLHHYPSYHYTKRTIYEESYLISDRLHKKLHELERTNYKEYKKHMDRIRRNKKILQKKKERYESDL